jgi:hypothetical protein
MPLTVNVETEQLWQTVELLSVHSKQRNKISPHLRAGSGVSGYIFRIPVSSCLLAAPRFVSSDAVVCKTSWVKPSIAVEFFLVRCSKSTKNVLDSRGLDWIRLDSTRLCWWLRTVKQYGHWNNLLRAFCRRTKSVAKVEPVKFEETTVRVTEVCLCEQECFRRDSKLFQLAVCADCTQVKAEIRSFGGEILGDEITWQGSAPCDGNIRVNTEGGGCVGADWICLPQDRVKIGLLWTNNELIWTLLTCWVCKPAPWWCFCLIRNLQIFVLTFKQEMCLNDI